MQTLSASIEIHSSAERIWSILVDFEAYPEWNPFIISAEGVPTPGSRLEVRIRPPGRRPTTFRPTVIRVEPNRELAWLGRLLLPGLFDGEHHLEIEPLDSDRSRFTQRENFTGLLVHVFGGMLRDTQKGFEAMNQALKDRAEIYAS